MCAEWDYLKVVRCLSSWKWKSYEIKHFQVIFYKAFSSYREICKTITLISGFFLKNQSSTTAKKGCFTKGKNFKNWNYKCVNNTWLQWFVVCRRSMGSLLHWLKSSFTKVRDLQYLSRNVFLYVHTFTFLSCFTSRQREVWSSISDWYFFSPFFLFVFFLLLVL